MVLFWVAMAVPNALYTPPAAAAPSRSRDAAQPASRTAADRTAMIRNRCFFNRIPLCCVLSNDSVGAHSICARGSLPCRKRARADMESAPTFFVGAPRVEFSPFVGNVIRGGAFYMRPQLFHDRAPTGGRGPDMSGPYRMLTGPPHPNAYRSGSAPRSRSRSPGRGPPRGRRTRRAGRHPAQSKRSCRVWLRRCSHC